MPENPHANLAAARAYALERLPDLVVKSVDRALEDGHRDSMKLAAWATGMPIFDRHSIAEVVARELGVELEVARAAVGMARSVEGTDLHQLALRMCEILDWYAERFPVQARKLTWRKR